MLSGLLKSVSQDSMGDRYLLDLMKGLDRLGRILFLFYWHGEEFAERYSSEIQPELEDGLHNAFQAMGDILLTLKKKTVEPLPDEGSNADLGMLAYQRAGRPEYSNSARWRGIRSKQDSRCHRSTSRYSAVSTARR